MTTCIAVAAVYLLQPVLAELAAHMGIAPADARLAFGIVSLAYAVAFYFVGPLSDRWDARAMSRAGLLACAAATYAAGWCTSDFHLFLVILLVQGVAAAMVPAAMFAIVPRIVPKEQIGTYFGLVLAATVAGITTGRASMGLFAAHLGVDGALRAFAVLLLLAAAVNQALPTLAPPRQAGSLAVAYMRSVSVLTNASTARLFLVGFLMFFGYLGTLTFLTLRLHQPPFSYDAASIGAFSLLGLSALLGAPLSGRLAGRFGSLSVALGGLSIVLCAVLTLGAAAGSAALGTGLVLLFLGVFASQPALLMRITQHVEPTRRGATSSLYLLTCLSAGSLASTALGPLWTASGWSGVIAAATLSVGGAIAALLLDRRSTQATDLMRETFSNRGENP